MGILSFLGLGLFEQLVLFPVAFGCRSKHCWNHFQVKQRAFGIRSATSFILKELEIFWRFFFPNNFYYFYFKLSRALTFLKASPYSSGLFPNSSSVTEQTDTGMSLVWSTILWECASSPWWASIYRPAVCEGSHTVHVACQRGELQQFLVCQLAWPWHQQRWLAVLPRPGPCCWAVFSSFSSKQGMGRTTSLSENKKRGRGAFPRTSPLANTYSHICTLLGMKVAGQSLWMLSPPLGHHRVQHGELYG